MPSRPMFQSPATWALMLIGFAGLGFAAYRRKSPIAAARLDRPALTYRSPLVRRGRKLRGFRNASSKQPIGSRYSWPLR